MKTRRRNSHEELAVDRMSYKAKLAGIETLDDLRGLPVQPEMTITDPHQDNNRRASGAAKAVTAYVDAFGGDEIATAISDLLADLKHLCDGIGADFDELLIRAENHYRHEVEGAL